MDDDAMRRRFLNANAAGNREEKRRLSEMMAMAPAQVQGTWESITQGLDKNTALLILNLIILAIVVWLLYTLAKSFVTLQGVDLDHVHHSHGAGHHDYHKQQ